MALKNDLQVTDSILMQYCALMDYFMDKQLTDQVTNILADIKQTYVPDKTSNMKAVNSERLDYIADKMKASFSRKIGSLRELIINRSLK